MQKEKVILENISRQGSQESQFGLKSTYFQEKVSFYTFHLQLYHA